MKKIALFGGLFTLCFCLVSARQETPKFTSVSQSAAASCWISQVPGGSPISVLSQSESGKESLAWLSYSGVVSKTVKFTMKYPRSSYQDKEIKRLSDPTGFFSATVPFAFTQEEFNFDEGSAVYKVKLDSGSCSYPFEFVDNGFESGDIPEDISDGVSLIESGIAVKNINTIQKVRVSLLLSHPAVGELEVYLRGPDMTGVTLLFNNAGSGTNFGTGFFHNQRTIFDDFASTPISSGTAPFVGSFVPQTPLSAFNGKSGSAANGIWRLGVADFTPGNGGQILGWALMIDDVDVAPLTWNSVLTKEHFLDSGFVPDATMEAKLATGAYSLDTIVNGLTDRLVDNLTCTQCHTGDAGTQFPNRYIPVYPVYPDRTVYQDRALGITYSFNDPLLIYQFIHTPNINKPPALEAIFQKWLDDGAKHF